MPKKHVPSSASPPLVSVALIDRRIYLIRGQKVMLDSDLAELYQVPTKAFNQAVRRNLDRFPEDFMFQLTNEEASALRSQTVTLERGRGRYSKYAPMAFSEHEAYQKRHDSVINILAEEIGELKRPPPLPPKRPIGFKTDSK